MLPRQFISRHRRRLLSLWTRQPGSGCERFRWWLSAGARAWGESGRVAVSNLSGDVRLLSVIYAAPQIGFLLSSAGTGICFLVDACYLCVQEGTATPPPTTTTPVLNWVRVTCMCFKQDNMCTLGFRLLGAATGIETSWINLQETALTGAWLWGVPSTRLACLCPPLPNRPKVNAVFLFALPIPPHPPARLTQASPQVPPNTDSLDSVMWWYHQSITRPHGVVVQPDCDLQSGCYLRMDTGLSIC